MAPHSILLPGKSHGRRSLVGCSPWGHKESDITSLSLFTLMLWRRKWQPSPVFLPGESQGWGSLVGCHLWGCTESDTTEATQQQQQQQQGSRWASLVDQMVKNLPAMWEMWVPSLGWEDPLEEGVATHSSILAWEIPWIVEPGGLQSKESQRVSD